MDITKQVNSITNNWKKASLLNSLYNGCFVALDSELNELHFSTYFINNTYFCKLWQYQFNSKLTQQFIPAHIHYWIPINDCNFDNLPWKTIKELPKYNEDIICWINYTIDNDPIRYIGNRIHIGIFEKGLFNNYLSSNKSGYINIPFNKVFRWCSIEDFVKINYDPRKLQLDPNDHVDVDWLLKLKK